jgi:hypothetical protein
MSKPTLQKIYEKLQMAKNHSDKLTVLGVEFGGEPAMALCIKFEDSLTPIAIMLDQQRADQVVPLWNTYETIQEILKGAEEIDDRFSIASFDGQYEKVDNYFLNNNI